MCTTICVYNNYTINMIARTIRNLISARKEVSSDGLWCYQSDQVDKGEGCHSSATRFL